jgi:hypothetical protein
MVGRASVLERKKRGGTTVQRCEGGARRGHQDVAASGVAVETRGRRPKLFFEGGDNEAVGDIAISTGHSFGGSHGDLLIFSNAEGCTLGDSLIPHHPHILHNSINSFSHYIKIIFPFHTTMII